MSNSIITYNLDEIQNRIFTIRGRQVMLDSHLAELYHVEIRVLNQAVKRNHLRFPSTFVFQLTESESDFLRSQVVILKKEDFLRSHFATLEDKRGKHRKFLPYVFTEQGVAMLSAILRSETAVKVSIQVMNAFVEMRRFINGNATLFQRMDRLEQEQVEAANKFEQIFRALETHDPKPEHGIFYDGQMFDSYVFIADLIRSAHKSIILFDNYIDESVLLLLTKRKPGVKATLFTKVTGILKQDLEKHNSQYGPIDMREMTHSHDRFLILDETELYHIGASLKDLGKKWFAFSRINTESFELLKRINEIT